jgi:chromosome segregation ATPase
MSTDEFDQRFTINRTCHETNSEPGDRHKYIHKSYSKATTPFLAEYPGRGRTMSQDELTSSTTRHTFQPKRFVLEQSITIDRQCTQTEDNNQQLRQQVNSLYRLFNILEDRNQELKTRVNDLTVKNEQLQQQSNNIDRRCNELEATNQNLAIQVNDLTVKNEQLQQQANNIDDKCNQLEVTNQNLGTQVNNLNEECKLLKAGKENLQKQICDLDQQLKTHDSQFNEIWMRIGKYDWRVDVCISTDG